MRSERYWVCLGCFARQVQLDACVRCGARDLVDVRSPTGRAAVARRVASTGRARADRAAQNGRELQAVMLGVALGGALLLLQLAAGMGSAVSRATMFMALLVPAVGISAVRWLGRRSDGATLRAVTPRLECVDRVRAEALEAPRALAEVSGTVRVIRAVEAPLSGVACAAARIAGSAFGAVDDAVCGAFELLDAQGAVVARFDGEGAAVDVAVGAAAAAESPRLWRFLDERMVLADGVRASVGEALIGDGDRLTLTGPADDAVVAEGYRERRVMKVFRGSGAWPVRLRREADAVTGVRVAADEPAEAVATERRDAEATAASRRR